MPYNMIYYNELLILLQLDYFLENSKKYSRIQVDDINIKYRFKRGER